VHARLNGTATLGVDEQECFSRFCRVRGGWTRRASSRLSSGSLYGRGASWTTDNKRRSK